MLKYIYESPDMGKTIYRRLFGKHNRELVIKKEKDITKQNHPLHNAGYTFKN